MKFCAAQTCMTLPRQPSALSSLDETNCQPAGPAGPYQSGAPHAFHKMLVGLFSTLYHLQPRIYPIYHLSHLSHILPYPASTLSRFIQNRNHWIAQYPLSTAWENTYSTQTSQKLLGTCLAVTWRSNDTPKVQSFSAQVTNPDFPLSVANQGHHPPHLPARCWIVGQRIPFTASTSTL